VGCKAGVCSTGALVCTWYHTVLFCPPGCLCYCDVLVTRTLCLAKAGSAQLLIVLAPCSSHSMGAAGPAKFNWFLFGRIRNQAGGIHMLLPAVLHRRRLLWHYLPAPDADDIPYVPSGQGNGQVRAARVWVQAAPISLPEPRPAAAAGAAAAGQRRGGCSSCRCSCSRHLSSGGSSSSGRQRRWQ
jgi:hypothetical protein